MKKVIILIVLALLIGGGLFWWFSRASDFLYAGTIEATEIKISSRVSSLIKEVRVKEGEEVVSGQVLLTLAGEDLKLSADVAGKEFQRGQELFKNGTITQAAFDQLKYKRDQSALLVEWCSVKAPQSATVLHCYREAGEIVTPGTILFTLGDLKVIWAFIYIEQPMIVRLKLNQTVSGLLPEMPGKVFPGRIVLIRDEAEFTPKNVQTRDERNRLVFGVKIVFANPEQILKPGMTIEVKLPDMEIGK